MAVIGQQLGFGSHDIIFATGLLVAVMEEKNLN